MRSLLIAAFLGSVLLTTGGCYYTDTCGTFVAACSQPPPSDQPGRTPTPCGAYGAAGCVSPHPPGPDAWPAGVVYRATDITGDAATELVPGTDLTVRFREPFELEVFAGCNTVTIRAHLQDGYIVADSFGATAIGCSEELLAQDGWIVDFFEDNPLWGLPADGELLLSTRDTEISFTATAG